TPPPPHITCRSMRGRSHMGDQISVWRAGDPPPAMKVLERILLHMAEDDGRKFDITLGRATRALEAIQEQLDAGYGRDDWNDLNSSYWQAAAGEELEAEWFFRHAKFAYARLNRVLNEVFEGE